MAECLKIRKEVARRCLCSCVGVCVREKEREGANCKLRTSENRAGCARVVS
jgi:chemotaxis receptor (MCP) glutamine deamidase CheD